MDESPSQNLDSMGISDAEDLAARGSVLHAVLYKEMKHWEVRRADELFPARLEAFKQATGETLRPPGTKVYFPLRSCEALFGAGQDSVVGAAKRAALLYDSVIFEPGVVYQQMPPMSPTCDFGPGILDELRHHEFDWVFEFGNPAQVGLIGKVICARALFEGASGRSLLEDERPTLLAGSDGMDHDLPVFSDAWWHRERGRGHDRWRAQLLAADLFGGMWVDASVAVAGSYAEMTRAVSGERTGAGSQSVELLLPDLHSIPWEAIAQFRDHPACEEARARLRVWEIEARADPERARAVEASVLRAAIKDFTATIEELRPRLPTALAQELAECGIGLIPVFGQVAGSVAGIGGAVAESRSWERSWQSAIVRLIRHRRTSEPLSSPDDYTDVKRRIAAAIESTWEAPKTAEDG